MVAFERNSIHHVGILSNNARRLVRFYAKNFGFKEEPVQVIPASIMKPIFKIACDCKMFKLKLNDVVLEIFQLVGRKAFAGRPAALGYNHWAISVHDRAAFCASLAKKKVKVIRVERSGHFVYFACDPDGNRIEVRDA